ncbi:MAG TPA: prepilin-type N-terminal cleavage/methylation domain-containing protein [Burkholderiaceae bacterium]|nr:prepilin-type N-terminal cleavage/methylation domain-containing protein [Burkholderiaceae bacterium]
MQRQEQLLVTRQRCAQRGVGLLEALIALAVLAFGMLAMTRFQTRMIGAGTEAQNRLLAMRFGDELLNMVRVDTDNVACYTIPQGTCASPSADSEMTKWLDAVQTRLPLSRTPVAQISGSLLTVTINWNAKATRDDERTLAAHQAQVTTDVRRP